MNFQANMWTLLSITDYTYGRYIVQTVSYPNDFRLTLYRTYIYIYKYIVQTVDYLNEIRRTSSYENKLSCESV